MAQFATTAVKIKIAAKIFRLNFLNLFTMKFATSRSPKRRLESGTEVKPKIDYFERLFSDGPDLTSPKRKKLQSVGSTSKQNLFDHFEEQRLNEGKCSPNLL
jgi:hypothetical protein